MKWCEWVAVGEWFVGWSIGGVDNKLLGEVIVVLVVVVGVVVVGVGVLMLSGGVFHVIAL